MAPFNAITLEKNAVKREKNERRRGQKPVCTSQLWAQTVWLDAKVTLYDGRVVFVLGERTWNFDGALLESTKRALGKLSTRPLGREEHQRLGARKQQWGLWHECASLENLPGADLRSRLVLESLMCAPLAPSPAREWAALPAREQLALGRELQNPLFPTPTRDLASWVGRNREHTFWRRTLEFPVVLACRLGFEGDAMPLANGPLALSQVELIALVDEGSPTRARQIAEFWSAAPWNWPDARPLGLFLQPGSGSTCSV